MTMEVIPMTNSRSTLIAAILVVTTVSAGLLIAAASTNPGEVSDQPVITGTISYLERIALPPQAEIEVKLIDAARMDAPATVIAQQTFTADGRQVPLSFELPYDPASISPMGRHQIQVRITVDGALRFISTTTNPVIDNGVTHVDVIVSPV